MDHEATQLSADITSIKPVATPLRRVNKRFPIMPLKLNAFRPGVTLVELLIVVAIIGLLLQLAIPAVEMSREAARRTACQNNLRQIGLACESHLEVSGRFPTGGWGFSWAGDPDRGDDKLQPGGWIYNILPFIEQQSLHALGKGESEAAKKRAAAQVCRTPLTLMICPSRRLAKLYPFDQFKRWPMMNTAYLEKTAKSDYAANAGDHFYHGYPGPISFESGDSSSYPWDDPLRLSCEPSKSSGPIYLRSEVRASHIIDGMSNTYLVGEKYLSPNRYKDGVDGGDDQSMYGGSDADVNRFVLDDSNKPLLPRQDSKGDESRYRFGSVHAESCFFVYCDGSVRAVNYSIDEQVHRAAGNRHDGGIAVSSP